MQIAGLEKFTTVDFPGKLSCVVFTACCTMRCWYCHNRALLDAPPLLDEGEVRSFLEKRRGFLEGVVLSGGEPTLQPDLIAFMRWLRSLGYRVKLDTNGMLPDVVARIVSERLADYVALDYKMPAARYNELSGDGSKVRETLAHLRRTRTAFELRTTVVPELSLHDLETMMREAGAVPVWYLQEYIAQEGHPLGQHIPRTQQDLRRMAGRLEELQPGIRVRGAD